MSQPRTGLSNLELRANILSENYQRELSRITALEIRDIRRRNPMLLDPEQLTAQQRKELNETLFWGVRSYAMRDGKRQAWPQTLAQRIPEVLAALEERPDLELALEVLCIARLLRGQEGEWQDQAASWTARARAVLARPEFRLTPEVIEQRLDEILEEGAA
jgi:hypothetical protein